MSSQPRDLYGLVLPLTIVEREQLNERAAEVSIPAAELARRLILRYLEPPRERDAVDERIGRTLMARAGATGHIPADASEQVSQIVAELKRAGIDPGKLGGT